VSDVHDEYVAGDINQIDDADDFDDYVEESSGNAEKALTASKVLSYVATSLCEDTEAVSVDVKDQGNKVLLSLNVGPNDMGRVIGRRGRTAQAIRALVAAAGARDGVTTSVDIVD
jgi:predicted RNA-binding protein YlqC (UPF0109 family)